MAKKHKLSYTARLRRLIEERFESNLESKRKQEARRRLETRRAQYEAAKRLKEGIEPNKSVVAVRRKLKGEAKRKTARLKQRKAHYDLFVPETLDLFTQYDQTASFLAEIRNVALRKRRNLRLVFDDAKHILPGAMLCLVAECYRCRNIDTKNPRVTGNYPADPGVTRILQDIGFFDLLEVHNPLPPQSDNFPLEYIKVSSGNRAVGEQAERLKVALLGDEIHMDSVASTKLYRGLTEAMTNVVHHAYPGEISSGVPRLRNRWWLVGHIDKKQRELMVMFFDQGVGIPATLPLRYPDEYINTILAGLRLSDPNDGHLIRAAMRIKRSQTLESHRGRGLNDFRAFIDQCGGGSLRIISRRGLYAYTADRNETSAALKTNLGGTFIEWTVPLEKISNWRGE
jgi:anti-sigma regulatory factor (Ser/Thr protein kinase)